MIDLLAHAARAFVLSRSCPDNSTLANEILEVCRADNLALLATADSQLVSDSA